jgi:hypothetical protein
MPQIEREDIVFSEGRREEEPMEVKSGIRMLLAALERFKNQPEKVMDVDGKSVASGQLDKFILAAPFLTSHPEEWDSLSIEQRAVVEKLIDMGTGELSVA